MEHWAEYMRFAVAIFVVVNPVGAIPVFVSLMGDHSTSDRRHAAVVAAVTVTVVLSVAVVMGDSMLRIFGIDVPYFQVGGGVLLLLIAISMFHALPSRAKQAPEEVREAGHQESVGVVPLGTPLLAGPGAISTAIIHSDKARSFQDIAAMVLICLLVGCFTWLVLRVADRVGQWLGRTGINIVNRLMGLILAALAVKFMADGLGRIFPALLLQATSP